MADTFVTSIVSGAKFVDGSTLSGRWTAEYDVSGTLMAVSSATFTITGSGGKTTFTQAGLLPYANNPSDTSYEIRFDGVSGGNYAGLYMDWQGETPTSLYQGTPSLYTSVVNKNIDFTPNRLVRSGTVTSNTAPSIAGLPASESGSDTITAAPFNAVTVSNPDGDASDSASITLSNNGTATDADGILSGTGLSKTGTGTYTLAATSAAGLSAELHALSFRPTVHQASPGSIVATVFALTVTDGTTPTTATTTRNETATCFLAGTHILTEHGEVEVQHLAAGNTVATLVDGAIVHQPIKWVGSRQLDAAAVAATGIRPVRIRAGAFAEAVPHRDLLVTPEHCILIEGRLVPARMLVNGRSIIEDGDIAAFTYHHIELNTHGVLLAEGLTTESYLDTGNRASFSNASVTALPLVPDHGSWALDACAPLATDRETVEPIWTRLDQRAAGLGMADGRTRTDASTRLSDDPRLRVLLDDGVVLTARWDAGGRHFFQIPATARAVRLLSRASVPADVVGPFVDDRRGLGVLVRAVVLWNGLQDTTIRAADIDLAGWHAPEADARWTDGDAALDLPPASGVDSFLEVHVTGSMLYRQDDVPLLLAA